MMESSIALMQMSRTVLAVNELKKHNLPYVVVLTNPTTGGVTASWAMLGDILIAEPKATIGFAGRRVIQDTVRETLPEEFQTAEYVRDHGGIDLVVERQYLRSTIGTLLSVLLKKAETQANTDTSNVVTIDRSLQKSSKQRYSRRINLDLRTYPKSFNFTCFSHLELEHPINILGSDGKMSTLTSLKYFLKLIKKSYTFTSPIFMTET